MSTKSRYVPEMIYEHTMMFLLNTGNDPMERALSEAQAFTAVSDIERGRRRTRVREYGNRPVKYIRFKFEGDENHMEALRERLWDNHEDIISTLTVAYPDGLTRSGHR